MLLVARLALLKRRKGLVFIITDPACASTRGLTAWLDRLRMVDQILVSDQSGAAFPQLRAPMVEVDGRAAIIEAVLASQQRKTRRAMARRGSQTSG